MTIEFSARNLIKFGVPALAITAGACSSISPEVTLATKTPGAINLRGIGTITPAPAFGTATETAKPTTIPKIATPEATATPETQYSVCSLANFNGNLSTIKDKCTIKADQLPDYSAWFDKSIAKRFDTNKVKVMPLRAWVDNNDIPGDNTPLTYDPSTKPNFPDAGSKPFQFGDTAAYVISGKFGYLTIPISYYDPENPNKNITLTTGFVVESTLNGKTWTMPQAELMKFIKSILAAESPTFVWSQCLNGNFKYSYGAPGTPVDPDLLECTTAKIHPEIQMLMQNFRRTGVPKGLDQPNIIYTPSISFKLVNIFTYSIYLLRCCCVYFLYLIK